MPSSRTSPEQADLGVQLEVVTEAGRFRVRPGTDFLIGRDPTCDAPVDHPSVSRRHLALRQVPEGNWTVTDLGSTGGTWLDGRRAERVVITGPLQLRLAHPTHGPAVSIRPLADETPPPGPGTYLGARLVGARVRVGRAPDNDVVIDDLTVSRHHCEVLGAAGRFEVLDLGSGAGTFLDGRRVRRAPLVQGSLIDLGRAMFVFRDGELHRYVDDTAAIVARDLTVVAGAGQRLLDAVSFAVEPGQMVAVIGTTGAGKSTLLKALTGFAPATRGSVSYNGRDLYGAADELRSRIGYVPQEDILHVQLKLGEALRYSAELRFADDTVAAERDARVEEVLHELGLSDRADVPIARLSGGQRKRASVAVELLTRPSLLFLDEPTSGLDPGFELSVMHLLRQLADSGRTVVVITHAVANLDLCDRVLFLAPGGRLAYFGPPGGLLEFFGADSYAEVFVRQQEQPRTDWFRAFRKHEAWARYVGQPLQRAAQPSPASLPPPGDESRPRAVSAGRQFRTLVRRNVAVLAGSRGYAALLVAQAPLIAALLLVSLGSGNLAPAGTGKPRAFLLVLMVAAVAMGLVNACREIVKELPIYRRERTVGLSLTAYLASKYACLGVLAVFETAVLVGLVVTFQGGSGSLTLRLGVVAFAVSLASVALGLAISALVTSDSAALVLVPVVIIGQLVLANGLFEVESKPALGQVAWLTPAYWGFSAAASSADLLNLDIACRSRSGAPASRSDAPCSSRWKPQVANLVRSLISVTGLTTGFAWVAIFALKRRDTVRARIMPRRR
jgi:ABC transport system ATP-binding/permease protein